MDTVQQQNNFTGTTHSFYFGIANARTHKKKARAKFYSLSDSKTNRVKSIWVGFLFMLGYTADSPQRQQVLHFFNCVAC